MVHGSCSFYLISQLIIFLYKICEKQHETDIAPDWTYTNKVDK